MADSHCNVGNTTECQTPRILSQAACEQRRKAQLDRDVVTELLFQRHDWLASESDGRKVAGYIQTIGQLPFYCSFYLEDQVKFYVSACRGKSGGVFNFDATGSVVRDLEHQKRPLYYCMLASDVNIPVLEFISTSHTADTIAYLIKRFLADVRLVTGGSNVKPLHVVTDFSFAVINAILEAFNRSTLGTYLQATFRVMHNKFDEVEVRSRTYVAVCIAHVMKALSVKLTKHEAKKERRQCVLTFFAALARTTTLDEAQEVYRNLYTVLCSPNITPSVMASQTALKKKISSVNEDDTAGSVVDDVGNVGPESDELNSGVN
jgi:hypothetical protein